MPRYTAYYMKPEFFRDGIMGLEWLRDRGQVPSFATLENTHVKVRELEAQDLEEVFDVQQGEIWSPKGERRELIRSLGLQHTSMSMGDCVVEQQAPGDTEILWIVCGIGFEQLDMRKVS